MAIHIIELYSLSVYGYYSEWKPPAVPENYLLLIKFIAHLMPTVCVCAPVRLNTRALAQPTGIFGRNSNEFYKTLPI